MSRFQNLTCLLCCLFVFQGCNKKEKADSQEASLNVVKTELIAVIDLNVVAQEIGAQAKIDVSLKKKEASLLRKFNGLKAELGRKVADLKMANQDLNDQLQNQLDELTAENSTKLTLQAQAAQSHLVAHHSLLKQKLLADIRPVAYSVAREQGMQIVLTVGQVYAAGPNVDITNEVVKRILTINSKMESGPGTEQPIAHMTKLPGGGEFVPR